MTGVPDRVGKRSPRHGDVTGPMLFDDRSWATRSGRLVALDLDFAVRCSDLVVGRYLNHVLSPFATDDQPPGEWWSIVGVPEGNGRSQVWVGDVLSGERRSPERVVAHVLWRVNQEVIRRSADRYLLFHASGAAWEGRGLVFPAAMEAGKTTLVSGLIRAGFQYLTDEAVAIDPGSLLVHPFPKALSIDEGSWEVLADFRPRSMPGAESLATTQWHVPVHDVRPGSTSGPVPVEFMVFPRYEPTGPTELQPMPRAEAFIALAENSFSLRRHGRSGFHAAAEAVRRARCYRLSVNDLDRACDLLIDLVAR